MEAGRSDFKILTGHPTGKTLSGRPRHKWEDNVRMDLKEIVVNTRKWLIGAQYRDYWREIREILF